MAKYVFFSFQYKPDNWRVQQVMNMGTISGESVFTPQDWEQVRRTSNAAIKKWIHKQMIYTKAVIVLVGATTWQSYWVKYEISKAWDECRPLIGVRIHRLKDQNGQMTSSGHNPFAQIRLSNGELMSKHVRLIDPPEKTGQTAYQSIERNLNFWVENYAYKRS